MNAAWFGCLPGVVELLGHGADAALRDSRGRSAMDLARQNGHTEVAERVVSRGNRARLPGVFSSI